jgi:hypothetical protein
MRSKALTVLLGLIVLAGSSAVAAAAEPVVLRVIVVETDNLDGYMKEVLEKSMPMRKRLQSPAVIRVWRARFAGDNAGDVVVSVEYPSLEAMARDEAKGAADPEWSAWLKGLDKMRKIVSDNLYTELKP